MSRAQTRARKRRRRMENDLREVVRTAPRAESDLHEAVHRARRVDDKAALTNRVMHHPRPGHGALYRLLRDLDRTDQRLWALADAIGCTEEEKAMIAQIVAPDLAGMTPGNVLHRHQLGQ